MLIQHCHRRKLVLSSWRVILKYDSTVYYYTTLSTDDYIAAEYRMKKQKHGTPCDHPVRAGSTKYLSRQASRQISKTIVKYIDKEEDKQTHWNRDKHVNKHIDKHVDEHVGKHMGKHVGKHVDNKLDNWIHKIIDK